LKALKALSKSFSVIAMSPSTFSFSADLAACFLLGVPDTACLSLEDADLVVFARFLFFSFVAVSSASFSSDSSL
jgi:hypothetical protein